MNHKTLKSWFHAAVAVMFAASAVPARANDPGALELGVATGWTRGFGPAAGGMMPNLQDLAGNGGAVHVDVGWRIDSSWLVGTYVETARLASGEPGTDGMTSVAAGVQGQLHLAPGGRLDPWIGLGFGWRGVWLDHTGGMTHAMQGLDLARLQLGLDHRVSARLAIAPTVGVAFTEFLSEKRPGASAYANIEDRKIGTFLFAGLSGRFDVLGGAADAR